MSAVDERIQCRKCREEIQADEDTCPHCGTDVRSSGKLIALAVLGAIIAATSFWNIGRLFLFFLIGAAMIGTSAFLLYDKRQRKQRAMS